MPGRARPRSPAPSQATDESRRYAPMVDRSHSSLQSVLDGLAAGADPDTLLREALAGSLVATRATDGAGVVVSGTECVPVAVSGRLSPVALGTARATMESTRLVRKQDAASGHTVAAEPLRAGARVLGALVVAGDPDRFDASGLALFAAAASAVVQRR